MNGRLYAPRLGRFLSADPFVQFPDAFQSYDRYAYVLNNPLRYTDPSGHFVFTAFAAMVVAAGQGTIHWAVAAALIGAATAADALIQGASLGEALKAGVIAGVATMVAYGIGTMFDPTTQTFSNALANGVASGGFAEMAGGDFGQGFLAGVSGSLTAPIVRQVGPELGRSGGTLVAAMVGGTISELGGGKFANGAITSAMIYMVSTPSQPVEPQGEWIYPEGGSTDINEYYDEDLGYIPVMTNGVGGDREAFAALVTDRNTPGFFNPSEGMLTDVFESMDQKLGFGVADGLALGFHDGVKGANHPLHITAHSQGTLTVINAAARYGLPPGSIYHLKSPALTYARANAVVRQNQGTLIYNQPLGDAAALWAPSFNPVKFGGSIYDILFRFEVHKGHGL